MQVEVSTTQELAPQKLQKAQQQESEVDSNHMPEVTSQTIDNMVIRVRDILSLSKEALDPDVQHDVTRNRNGYS
jgi:hypothetical protein